MPTRIGAIVGVYFFTPAVHAVICSLRPSGGGELEITDAIGMLVAFGRDVRALPVNGYCKDTGRVEDVLDCNRVILDEFESSCDGPLDSSSEVQGAVSIGLGAHVTRSRINGPAIIGTNAVITDSTLGPHVSVGDDAVLDRATMANSIAMEHARVGSVTGVRDFVIGHDTRIRGTRQRGVITGDDCLIEMIA